MPLVSSALLLIEGDAGDYGDGKNEDSYDEDAGEVDGILSGTYAVPGTLNLRFWFSTHRHEVVAAVQEKKNH